MQEAVQLRQMLQECHLGGGGDGGGGLFFAGGGGLHTAHSMLRTQSANITFERLVVFEQREALSCNKLECRRAGLVL